MDKIEVAALHESHSCPAGMMMFLAKLTQRGHNIKNMEDLMRLYDASLGNHKPAAAVACLPHGTIKRFTPITIAIVGASRRFLAQARTHQVGINYVSGSLQYSDYSDSSDFVIPYELMENPEIKSMYLETCKRSMSIYKRMVDGNVPWIDGAIDGVSNDTAGYAAPQGLRNILIMQGNHEAWMTFIRLRGCNRNTIETQYVTMLIWEALNKTNDGIDMFNCAGPDCMFGRCREGSMSCGKPMLASIRDGYTPTMTIEEKWPLVKR